MESGGGPGAGGFCMFPEEADHKMDGWSFRLALRRRIGFRGKRVPPRQRARRAFANIGAGMDTCVDGYWILG